MKQTGNVEQQQKTFRDLLLAFGLAILLVYVVMASQFQSFIDPFIIMFTIPLGIAGVFWTLFLTDTTLSVTSAQGIIVMVGIVVSNGILLVDYTNKLRASGVELHEAVVRGGRTRLKPILMTSLATVLGLIPMAIGMGGESTQAPLAIAVIGGLTFSTTLTLFFIPILYTIFEERFKREMRSDDDVRGESYTNHCSIYSRMLSNHSSANTCGTKTQETMRLFFGKIDSLQTKISICS